MKFWTKSKRRLMHIVAQETGLGELDGGFTQPEMTLLSLWRAGFLEIAFTAKGKKALAHDLDVDIDGEPHDSAASKRSKGDLE